ncbi:hypothetical protein [Paenibacillus sp. sgz500958]|uniref:hypothetical protein n=1 Tax=Paenibacillus sp. sgz500958 TaxID=3242475 RepID=UPI0036D2F22B
MSWEPVGFMFFSTLEFFAWYALSLAIFRFKMTDYAWQALFVIILMNLQSYVLRNELSLEFIVPLTNILIFTLLFTTVVRIPIASSLIVTISGFIVFAIIQTVIVEIVFGSIAEAQSTLANGYALQSMTAVIVFPLALLLYKYGYGFSFNLERLRFKFEHVITISTIVIFLAVMTFTLYYNRVWINIFFFAVTLLFFLYYATGKEREA